MESLVDHLVPEYFKSNPVESASEMIDLHSSFDRKFFKIHPWPGNTSWTKTESSERVLALSMQCRSFFSTKVEWSNLRIFSEWKSWFVEQNQTSGPVLQWTLARGFFSRPSAGLVSNLQISCCISDVDMFWQSPLRFSVSSHPNPNPNPTLPWLISAVAVLLQVNLRTMKHTRKNFHGATARVLLFLACLYAVSAMLSTGERK